MVEINHTEDIFLYSLNLLTANNLSKPVADCRSKEVLSQADGFILIDLVKITNVYDVGLRLHHDLQETPDNPDSYFVF